MEGIQADQNRTVEEVFADFKSRRAGLIKALTTEVDKFLMDCDPAKDNLCLYGLPSESWEVSLPADQVPPELPEPALGINFARDGMQQQDWLSLVAVHGDSWLLSVAFYFGARFGFGKTERKRLFQMINDLPTVFEVVTGVAKPSNDVTANQNNGNRTKAGGKTSRSAELHPKPVESPPPEEEVGNDVGEEEQEDEHEEEEEQGTTLCGACGEEYSRDEFWICCDVCERWYHGKCVKITPAKAAHIKQYKCPGCSSKRARVHS